MFTIYSSSRFCTVGRRGCIPPPRVAHVVAMLVAIVVAIVDAIVGAIVVAIVVAIVSVLQ